MSLFVKFNLILILVFAIALVPADLHHRTTSCRKTLARRSSQHARTHDADGAGDARATRTSRSSRCWRRDSPRSSFRRSVPAYSATEIFNTCAKRTPSTRTRKPRSTRRTRATGRSTGRRTSSTPSARTRSCTEIIGERDAPLGRSLYLARPIAITDPGLSVLPHVAGSDAGLGRQGATGRTAATAGS